MPGLPSNRRRSQIQFIQFLQKMGYRFRSSEEVAIEREGAVSQVFLLRTLRSELRRLNGEVFKADELEGRIEQAITDLLPERRSNRIVEGERIHSLLLHGVAGFDSADHSACERTLYMVDWNRPERNCFEVAADFPLRTGLGRGAKTVDLVLFLNGVPFAFAMIAGATERELLSFPSVSFSNGVDHHQAALFACCSLQCEISDEQVRFGGAGCPREKMQRWSERSASDLDLSELVKATPEREGHLALFRNALAPFREEFERCYAKLRKPSVLESFLWRFFRPDRLLGHLRQFVVFDFERGRCELAGSHQMEEVRWLLKASNKVGQKRRKRVDLLQSLAWGDEVSMLRFLGKTWAVQQRIVPMSILFVGDSERFEKDFEAGIQQGASHLAIVEHARQLSTVLAERGGRFISTRVAVLEEGLKQMSNGENANLSLLIVLVDHQITRCLEIGTRVSEALPWARTVIVTDAFSAIAERQKLRSFARARSSADRMGGALRVGARVPVGVEAVSVQSYWYPLDAQETFPSQELADAWNRLKILPRSKSGKDDSAAEDVDKRIAWNISRHFGLLFVGCAQYGVVVVRSPQQASRLAAYFDAIGLLQVRRLHLGPADEATVPPLGQTETLKGPFIERRSFVIVVDEQSFNRVDDWSAAVVYDLSQYCQRSVLGRVRAVQRPCVGKKVGLILLLQNCPQEEPVLGQFSLDAKKQLGRSLWPGIVGPIFNFGDDLPLLQKELNGFFGPNDANVDEPLPESCLLDDAIRFAYDGVLIRIHELLWRAFSSPQWIADTGNRVAIAILRDIDRHLTVRRRVAFRLAEDWGELPCQLRVDRILKGMSLGMLQPPCRNMEGYDWSAIEDECKGVSSDGARGDVILFRLRRELNQCLDDNPFFFRSVADKACALIRMFRDGEVLESDYFREAQRLLEEFLRERSMELNGPKPASRLLVALREAVRRTFGSHPAKEALAEEWTLAEASTGYRAGLPAEGDGLAEGVLRRVGQHQIVNWLGDIDAQNRIRNEIDDFVFEWARRRGMTVSVQQLDAFIDSVFEVFRSREND